MNKKQALEKLHALEKEAQALRKIIEAPERLLEVGGDSNHVHICTLTLCNDENISNEYYKAFKTFLQLRQQEGSEAPLDGEVQFLIKLDTNTGLYVGIWQCAGNKVSSISPCFRTTFHAEKAIAEVGKENIIHMFNTFHGIYE